ncbi:Crp/Fnr family transcriptional regulator [Chryseobacterium sp. SSA4.19]|uniref:Crp/Fnr family transcriptional regulator n=1 Tax=Chryseobacterium sp. SSA4.19 TaxID=2919915 RepID=UPI001F4EA63A|nr:Crp/Fnr family transcriptional regulator [Chryseobacterium sp. SSA4.19]MCJ8154570.1 Crp/Fnr family transcriptional regulator [Chryseobacterium sp. SSA4.19]
MNKKITECSHTCFMCQHILPEWWEVINVKRDIIKVKKGQKFIEEGSKREGVFFIQDGFVKVHKHWGEREMIVRFAKKGEIVGHRGISAENMHSPISATAMQDSVLCFVELDFFKTLLKANISLSYELMMFYADELQWSEQKMGSFIHLSVKERFVINLNYLIKHFGLDESNTLQIELSKTEMAAYIGTTYETMYRVIAEMENADILTFSGKQIEIISLTKLQAQALS